MVPGTCVRNALAAGASLWAVLFSGAALAQELSCPPNIELTPAATVSGPPIGWEPRAFPEMHFLSGARLFVGDPEDRVQLREDPLEDGYEWPVERTEDDPPFVLVCVYEGTEMTLLAEVPEKATRCAVRTFPEDSHGVRFGKPVTGRERTEVVCR